MSNNKLEQFNILVQQLFVQYKVVERTIDQICSRRGTASETENLQMIKQLLSQVRQTEAEIQPLRDSLQANNATIPDSTQAIIDDTIQMVTTLIPKIGALEKEAVESREKLAPEIHEGVRAAKTKTAYARQRN